MRLIFLINDVKEDGVYRHVAVDVDLEAVVPPQQLSRALYIHSGVQNHLPAGHVSQEVLGVVGQFQPTKASREAYHLAGARRLGAGFDAGGAEEGAGVEDGHLGRGVLDGGDVGVGDVDGEDDVGVEDGEVEVEGGEVDGDEVEGWVPWLR